MRTCALKIKNPSMEKPVGDASGHQKMMGDSISLRRFCQAFFCAAAANNPDARNKNGGTLTGNMIEVAPARGKAFSGLLL
jgi:hypothetical protein